MVAKELDYEHPADLARFAPANAQRLQPVFRNAVFEITRSAAAP